MNEKIDLFAFLNAHKQRLTIFSLSLNYTRLAIFLLEPAKLYLVNVTRYSGIRACLRFPLFKQFPRDNASYFLF